MSVYPIILSQNKFPHRDTLKYPFEDRGLQFGDGIYEVIRIYHGNFYLLEEHVDRLFHSAEAIKLILPFTKEELINMLISLLEKNNITQDGKLYIQITRGSAPRNHVFPENTTPNVFAYIEDLPRDLNILKNGVSTITLPDTRWENCYIKSLNLLPNILAKQEAKEKGCYEAILHKNGIITECSSANVFLVKSNKIYTFPATRRILHGCVRSRILQFAQNLNITVVEEEFSVEDIMSADELFLTSSVNEVLPIVEVDGTKINDGKPGAITKQLQLEYERDANIQTTLTKPTV